MPGSLIAIDKLNALAVPANQQMRRDQQMVNLSKKRVLVWVQAIGKQRFYSIARELPRRQANGVQEQQRYLAVRACILVRRRYLPCPGPLPCPVFLVHDRTRSSTLAFCFTIMPVIEDDAQRPHRYGLSNCSC